ncbi:MAG: hypothetical protein ACI83W_000024 [Marinoscillum sp.]|jgi:hypothetical protein
MNAATSEVNELLKENGYLVSQKGGFTHIRRAGSSKKLMFVLSSALGLSLILFTILGDLSDEYGYVGILILVLPLITQRWKAPHEMIIEPEVRLTLLSGVSFKRIIKLANISSLEVDENILTSDVSPFKDGYRDFIYNFNLITNGKSRTILSLTFRKESAEEVKSVFEFLSSLLSLDKKRSNEN